MDQQLCYLFLFHEELNSFDKAVKYSRTFRSSNDTTRISSGLSPPRKNTVIPSAICLVSFSKESAMNHSMILLEVAAWCSFIGLSALVSGFLRPYLR